MLGVNEKEKNFYDENCPYCSKIVTIYSNRDPYQICEHCDKAFEIVDSKPVRTRSPFRYKNGVPIKFFKCEECSEIITGCLHHANEKCKCGRMIDQESGYSRIDVGFVNVTNDIDDKDKRFVFTKTVFNANKRVEDWIKNQIKRPGFVSEIFDIDAYKTMYKHWKKEEKNNEKL